MKHDANGRESRRRGSGRSIALPDRAAPRDVVFDFSDTPSLDVPALSLLFTTRQIMHEKDRPMWVTGLPPHFWNYLRSMGLEGWFRRFPGGGPGEA